MIKFKKAFTLTEIMVVMAIVGVLVAVAIVEGINFRKQANESNCKANLKAIACAFEVYAARNGGVYAPGEENNLRFLIDASCLNHDLTAMEQLGNFRYVVGQADSAGYDIRAMAVNAAFPEHNYQISTGGTLRRSDTSGPTDTNFKVFN